MREGIKLVDPSRTARAVILLTWAWFAVDVLFDLASLQTINILGGFGGSRAPKDRVESSENIGIAVYLALVAVNALAAVAILRWTYLVNRNAHGFGGRMTSSPGLSVFWFFVPVLSLWKPFKSVRESWQATLNPSSPGSVPVPAVMRYWWGAWLASSHFGTVSGRIAGDGTAAGVINANWLNVAALPVDLMLALTFTALVRRLSRLQAAALARTGANSGSQTTSEDVMLPSPEIPDMPVPGPRRER